jgi:hypothetical protein
VRALSLAMLAVSLGAEAAAANELATAAPQPMNFAVSRNGQPIGHHTLTIVRDGDSQIVTVNIEFAVRMMGVAVYRYSHHSREVWRGERLQSLVARTNDNGTGHVVRATRHGDNLKIDRAETPVTAVAASLEQVTPEGNRSASDIVPGNLLTTSHWNPRQPAQSVLLHTQFGTPSHVQVSNLGRDSVRPSRRTVLTTRYRYAGDVRFDQWYDASGRWVKAAFTAHDGSTIEYTLQE